MVIRKIPKYTFETEQWESLSKKTFQNTDFLIELPELEMFTDREQVLFDAQGSLTAKVICRTLDMAENSSELMSLRNENCFDANEKDEWILDVSFTTKTPKGVVLTQFVRLPLSLPQAKTKPVTLWFNGTWMRLMQDGEVLNENSGYGVLCDPVEVSCNADISIAAVKKVKKSFRTWDKPHPEGQHHIHNP